MRSNARVRVHFRVEDWDLFWIEVGVEVVVGVLVTSKNQVNARARVWVMLWLQYGIDDGYGHYQA